MIFSRQNCSIIAKVLSSPSRCYSNLLSVGYGDPLLQSTMRTRTCDLDAVISKVVIGSTDEEIFHSLANDPDCKIMQLSHDMFDKLLHRFKDDWKSALGVFKWAGSREDFKHAPGTYDVMVDILGKMKQMDRMRAMLEEMNESNLVSLNTMGKVMRRFCGAGLWEDAVKMFDELGNFGLEKNVESMNLLLDTLSKENRVEQARAVFLQLKPYILPNAHTFNILIHGWCKVNRVDEAHWTIQEMKGHGYHPCVISYSTIIRHYCRHSNLHKVYQLFGEMEAQGCPPNIVTYTSVMCTLAKSGEFEEALRIADAVKSSGCKPDVLFYNALIHVLGRAGKLQDAVYVFEMEMPKNGIVPNTSTYNTMISMFCHHALEERALNLLEEMENSTLCKPDVQTYHPLLKFCFRAGKTDNLLAKLLYDMVNRQHLSLDISSYSLLIHRLCRANKCDWAYALFEEMIGQDISPRYQTCRLLLDELKEKHMYSAAERIENVMKKL